MDLVQDFSPATSRASPSNGMVFPVKNNGKVTNLRLQVTSKMNDVTIK
jgi:hypothetical protein